MIIFTFGAVLCIALLAVFYLMLSGNRKIIDYRKKEHLLRLISQNNFQFLLIDIRSEADYLKDHIPASVNIPLKELLQTLPVENMFLTIIICGANKKDSSRAAEFLSEQGYFNVTSFGSVSRWKGEMIRNEYIGDKHIENSSEGRFHFPI